MEHVSVQQLEEITRRLVDALHPVRVLLYGSHAYGRPGPHSDVDILVVVPESDRSSYERDAQAYRALRGIGVPIEVQVYTVAEFEKGLQVPLSLERTVQQKGRVLYAA